MRIFVLLLTMLLASAPAYAGVVVSVWSPGVVVFDPYGPEYVPGPRADYYWVPGGYDEYGYYSPGYWQPVAPNPGYIWAAGHWSGRVYYEGYWRPEVQIGQAWIGGYYVGGRYVSPRWVSEREADHARAAAHARVASQPRRDPPGQRSTAKPAHVTRPASHPTHVPAKKKHHK